MKKVLVVGHSLIHVRQQNFFRELCLLGHEVMLVSPKYWRGQKILSYTHADFDKYQLTALDGFSDIENYTPYSFTLIGLEDVITAYSPDIIYAQAEPGSKLLHQVHEIADKLKLPFAVFLWENMRLKGGECCLLDASVIICGNDSAEELVWQSLYASGYSKGLKTYKLPQVGVDTDHFTYRDIARTIDVAYIGRASEEKGVQYLQRAYPDTKFLEWKSYESLPWFMSQCKVVVCPSIDTFHWREQAMPYVSAEAMACERKVVVSDAGSIKFWHQEFGPEKSPALIVPQKNPVDLRVAILEALDAFSNQTEERDWVVSNLSSKVIAQRLSNLFEAV
jgi:glycosyltransferase involved in cell wall biosynthesis